MFSHRRSVVTHSSGFTLLEIMVALAIIAIALSAATKAAMTATDAVRLARLHTMAGYIANNRMAEHHCKKDFPLIGAISTGEDEQGGVRFQWEESVSGTPYHKLRRIDILVKDQKSQHVFGQLTGYLVQREN
jgi:general secretion pathway protein I